MKLELQIRKIKNLGQFKKTGNVLQLFKKKHRVHMAYCANLEI